MPDDVTTPPSDPASTPDTERTGTNAFYRLAPFIQEFIWKHAWTELREIQVRAAAAAFETDKHLLLASGTASGKTEAVFLPILTQLFEDPPSTIGALYIGPLKALINDQFLRLGDLCVEAEIPVTAWHGDVAASRKHALLKHPSGILQITPEALEGLLLNRPSDLMRLFGDLRWVVIDEVHAFMASDRGGQVLALLDRLARYALDKTRLPRRAGLSATLGDYAEAAAWLEGASQRGVEVIAEQSGRTVYLLVDHFVVKPEHERGGRRDDVHTHDNGIPYDGAAEDRASGGDLAKPRETNDDAAVADRLIARERDLFQAAYEATQKRKSLIFTNSRRDAEETITGLRRMAELDGGPDMYYVHHGSIAAPLREAAESAMRDSDAPACTAATVTLELGIDLGQLDRVLQLGPTFTVASFLQRLGRTGRRGQRPEMLFLLREEEHDSKTAVLDRIPWELLQAIAIIQLYSEEKWLEPLASAQIPGSLLYQQAMSVVGAAGELTPPQLAERVLTLAPFRNVTQEDFRTLLLHLIDIDHLERTEEQGLILGLAGEKVVRNFRFLATFHETTEWSVKEGSRDIGTIAGPVPQGERFVLAGRTWEVMELVTEQRLVIVQSIRGSLRTHFIGGRGGDVHDRVAERMRRLLAEDVIYPYLTERAVARLADARQLALAIGIAKRPAILALGGNEISLVPWAGTRVLRTLELKLGHLEGLKSVRSDRFYLTCTAVAGGADAVRHILAATVAEPWEAAAIVAPLDPVMCERAKYDEFLPEALLRKAFSADHLDAEGAHKRLEAALQK